VKPPSAELAGHWEELKMSWVRCRASDLFHEFEREELTIPRVAAIYAWRRDFSKPATVDGADETEQWVKQMVVGKASGIVGPTNMAHCLRVGKIELGGGELSDEKASVLHEVCQEPGLRKTLETLIFGLTDLSITLYVGETEDLNVRVRQHFREQSSGLKSYMQRLELDWDDVALEYFQLAPEGTNLPANTKKLLELFEMITQRALAPLGTERPG
jgi:hypothetical protein